MTNKKQGRLFVYNPLTKFTTNPISSLGLDGNFYCKVLEIIPLKKLSYSWKGGSSENEEI